MEVVSAHKCLKCQIIYPDNPFTGYSECPLCRANQIQDVLSSQAFSEKLVDVTYRLLNMGLVSFDEWWMVYQETIKREIGE